jgi:DNA repair protein RadD
LPEDGRGFGRRLLMNLSLFAPPVAPTLRPYQRRAVDQLYAWFEMHSEGNPCIVLPTGSGKSHVIATICKEAVQSFPSTRILMLTHVKELIEQDVDKLLSHWSDAPVGIYSAGIGKKEIAPITFAGIQSIWKKADKLGHIDLIIIDEAHLVNHAAEGCYRKLIDALTDINPDLRIIGLTATPYRMGHGMITDNPALFDATIEPVTIAQLQRGGYLAMLRSKATTKKLSTEGVHLRGGEYIESELQAAVDVQEASEAVVDEVIKLASDRKAWLFFCTGVDHAQHVAEILTARGITTACITGATPKTERAKIIDDFKAGKIQALTNANVLTTGFDYPDIDLIVMMRPTMSPGLYVQMAGRGLRVKSDKGDCLVLDFAGVVERHGPITLVRPPKKKGKGEGVAPSKVCPQCEEIIGASAKKCPCCGYVFPVEKKGPDWYLRQDDIMGLTNIVMAVKSWHWELHMGKTSGKQSLQASYYGGLSDPVIREWLVVFHEGYPGQYAMEQLASIARHAGVDIWKPESPEELVDALNQGRPPASVEFRKNGKFYRVKDRIWSEKKEEEENGDQKAAGFFL